MIEYTLKLRLKSPALIGSGTGYGALIDVDVVYDDLGIPYIPAKRIKGCLLDSAKDVEEMIKLAGIDMKLDIDKTFGEKGQQKEAPVYFENLVINQYDENTRWLKYFWKSKDYSGILSKDVIIEMFTEERHQTAIADDGIALKNSLRTMRLVRKNHEFYGKIIIHDDSAQQVITNTLIAACSNFRSFGAKRNKGLGEVECELFDKDKLLSIEKQMEGLI
ncbi:MAG: RAMP superfamily CRISPR-associated protein [Candidatus Zhuqueibacterota bacterium]